MGTPDRARRRREVEAEVQRTLRQQDGVITRAQARSAGLTPDGIRAQVAAGRWSRPLRGVYVVGGVSPGAHRSTRVALAGAGPGAVASHRSAAWLWGLTDHAPAAPSVSVATPRHPVLQGVEVHRSDIAFEPARRRGLPCTTVARTLLDCAGMGSAAQLADLVDRALAARLVALPELVAATTGGARRLRGRTMLRHCLADRGLVGGPAPSVLESRMARLFRSHGLPVPKAELVWGDRSQYRLDFAYPALRLSVEVDGYAWHASPEQFARDHRRRNELVTAGWTLLVYGWRDVTQEPGRVAAEVARAHRDRSAQALTR